MALRAYTVYLKGGGSFTIKAARFEVSDQGVVFYNENDRPIEDTYIDPQAVVAVLPPSPPATSRFPSA